MSHRTARTAVTALLLALTAVACEDSPPGESKGDQVRAAMLRGDAERRIKQAAVSMVEGDYEQANIHAQWAIVASPDYAPAYHTLAWISLNLGNDQLQLTAALEAVRLAPDSASYRHTLGVMFEDLGQLRNAEQAYRDAVRMDPTIAQAWLDLARVTYRGGRWVAADSAFDRVAELMPAHFDTAADDAQMRADASASAGD